METFDEKLKEAQDFNVNKNLEIVIGELEGLILSAARDGLKSLSLSDLMTVERAETIKRAARIISKSNSVELKFSCSGNVEYFTFEW